MKRRRCAHCGKPTPRRRKYCSDNHKSSFNLALRNKKLKQKYSSPIEIMDDLVGGFREKRSFQRGEDKREVIVAGQKPKCKKFRIYVQDVTVKGNGGTMSSLIIEDYNEDLTIIRIREMIKLGLERRLK